MTSLVQYAKARVALAEAFRVEQVLPILEEVENVRAYARQINDQELLADATEYQMRSERRLGEILKAAKAAGHFKEGRPAKQNGSSCTEPLAAPPTLQEVGVSKKLSSRSQKRAGIAEQAFEVMVQATRERIAAANASPLAGGRSMAPGRKEPSASLDFSPTPPYATRALFERVFPAMGMGVRLFRRMSVHEPACGEGHMAEVLREYFGKVIASDIHDYGYGGGDSDFLDEATDAGTHWIITNPPFKEKAELFALKAIKQAQAGVAIFARLQWLETVGRYDRLFRDHPPTQIAFFAERVNLCMGRWDPDGGTATAYIWLVWLKDRLPMPPFWIPPGCKESLSRDDDVERFTAHPVIKRSIPLDSSNSPIPHDEDGQVVESVEDDLSIPNYLRRAQ